MIEFDGSVAYSQKARLPKESGIYFVYDSKDELYYIGQAKNIYHRWARHTRLKQVEMLDKPVVKWILVAKCELDKVESSLIKSMCPAWNNTEMGLESFILLNQADKEAIKQIKRYCGFTDDVSVIRYSLRETARQLAKK